MRWAPAANSLRHGSVRHHADVTVDGEHQTPAPPTPASSAQCPTGPSVWRAPPYRDPLAWWTLAMASLAISALSTSEQPSPLLRWLDVLLGSLVLTLLFAVLPAVLRLKVRRMRWRRAQRHHDAPRVDEVGRLAHRRPAPTAPAASGEPPLQSTAATTRWSSAPRQRSQDRPPEPPQPTTISEDAVASSPVLAAARELPYPVARAVRALQAAPTAKE